MKFDKLDLEVCSVILAIKIFDFKVKVGAVEIRGGFYQSLFYHFFNICQKKGNARKLKMQIKLVNLPTKRAQCAPLQV